VTGARQAPARSVGLTIARFKIVPVAVFGRDETIQTSRGYL
jgi:hypothetical protein